MRTSMNYSILFRTLFLVSIKLTVNVKYFASFTAYKKITDFTK